MDSPGDHSAHERDANENRAQDGSCDQKAHGPHDDPPDYNTQEKPATGSARSQGLTHRCG